MDFPTIRGQLDPEEYSWQVTLGPDRELEQTDDQHARVFYGDGTTAMTITAEEARDASGASVPTSLAVSAGDVITLTVHHRAGNPAAGMIPFQYPVSPGPSFETGYSTVIVTGPFDEKQLREERERAPAEAEAAQRAATEVAPSCRVPTLRFKALRAAKRQLRKADCRIGAVAKRAGAAMGRGKVVVQHPRAGTELPAGAEVDLTLGTLARS